MSFPSSSGARGTQLQNAWQNAISTAASLKSNTQKMRADAIEGTPVTSSRLFSYLESMARNIESLTEVSSVPGLATYAQQQLSDPSIDLPAEFSAMFAAAVTVRDWMANNFPSSGGYLLAQTLDAAGRRQDRTFTTAQLAGFVAELDKLLATID